MILLQSTKLRLKEISTNKEHALVVHWFDPKLNIFRLSFFKIFQIVHVPLWTWVQSDQLIIFVTNSGRPRFEIFLCTDNSSHDGIDSISYRKKHWFNDIYKRESSAIVIDQ